MVNGSGQVDVCKLVPTFPRSMSACVRECFARLGCMDPELRGRLSEWLAYHLSNFEFMWPWDKWRAVLDAPAHDSQRRASPRCSASQEPQAGSCGFEKEWDAVLGHACITKPAEQFRAQARPAILC